MIGVRILSFLFVLGASTLFIIAAMDTYQTNKDLEKILYIEIPKDSGFMYRVDLPDQELNKVWFRQWRCEVYPDDDEAHSAFVYRRNRSYEVFAPFVGCSHCLIFDFTCDKKYYSDLIRLNESEILEYIQRNDEKDQRTNLMIWGAVLIATSALINWGILWRYDRDSWRKTGLAKVFKFIQGGLNEDSKK